MIKSKIPSNAEVWKKKEKTIIRSASESEQHRKRKRTSKGYSPDVVVAVDLPKRTTSSPEIIEIMEDSE